MDRKLALLTKFYGGLPKDRAKVETLCHGFAFLEDMLSDGTSLEYGELTLSGKLHKYKLANIPPRRMEALLRAHLEKECNVCLYFDDRANSLFCFNLDNNHKVNNTAILPEMEVAVRSLWQYLARLGCEPLVIASGRGYHLLVRKLDGPVDNDLLYDFMLRLAAKTLAAIHEKGYDFNKGEDQPLPRPQDPGRGFSAPLRVRSREEQGVRPGSSPPRACLIEQGSWTRF